MNDQIDKLANEMEATGARAMKLAASQVRMGAISLYEFVKICEIWEYQFHLKKMKDVH